MNKKEIIDYLKLTGEDQIKLFEEARKTRLLNFGNKAVLRGVIEVTNVCRVNCDYCPMRKDNAKYNNTFYLTDEDMILNSVRSIKENGINVVFFQGGETPKTTKIIGELLPKIRKIYDDDVEILLNLGIKTENEYKYLFEQGATSYILKHETSDPLLHQKLRHEPLSLRIQALKHLKKIGYKIGTGMIVGLPDQTIESIADDILLAKEIGVDMCSVAPFVPAPNTPLQANTRGSKDISLNAIAIMRLISPEWLIPSVSALEKNEDGGQVAGFAAGANVMTINFTPTLESEKYLIYGKDRFLVKTAYATETLALAKLRPRKSVFINTSSPI